MQLKLKSFILFIFSKKNKRCLPDKLQFLAHNDSSPNVQEQIKHSNSNHHANQQYRYDI